MPSVIDTLEAAEVHIQAYQETTPITPAASQSRFATMLTSLRTGLTFHRSSEVQANTPFETGIDRLTRTYPYDFIQSLG